MGSEMCIRDRGDLVPVPAVSTASTVGREAAVLAFDAFAVSRHLRLALVVLVALAVAQIAQRHAPVVLAVAVAAVVPGRTVRAVRTPLALDASLVRRYTRFALVPRETMTDPLAQLFGGDTLVVIIGAVVFAIACPQHTAVEAEQGICKSSIFAVGRRTSVLALDALFVCLFASEALVARRRTDLCADWFLGHTLVVICLSVPYEIGAVARPW